MFWIKASMSQGRDSKRFEWNQSEKPLNDMNQEFSTPYSRNFDLEFMNASSNDTADIEIDTFYFYQTEQISVLCFLFLVIVIGNISILITLSTGRRKKSRMDFFIKQLALADLMVGLISVLTDIIWRITVTWHAGNAACKIIRFMQVIVTYSSTYVLVALSIDRYDAIAKPMNFSRSWWRAQILIGFAWGFSLLFAIPILFLYEEKSIQGTLQCWIELASPLQWQIYMCIVSFTVFVAPTIIIATCYALIVYTIWTQNGTIKNGISEDLRRASSRGLIPRAKIKTIKMTFGIVFVFILCWSPYIIFDLLQVFGYVPVTQTNIAMATFIQSLAPLNSAANPIIYCIFSTSFCTRVRNMLAVSWIPGWCSAVRQHCFGNVTNPESTRTTMTSSLTANSSHSRGNHGALRSTASKKRVMVSMM